MFDIGWSELLVIAVVAIIFIGPRELIPMLRAFGQYAGKLKRMASEFQSQFNEALREVEVDSLTKDINEIGNISPLQNVKDEVEKQMKPLSEAVETAAAPINAPDTGATAKTPAAKPKAQTASKPAGKKTASEAGDGA